jgi:hypothetical protein
MRDDAIICYIGLITAIVLSLVTSMILTAETMITKKTKTKT